MRTVLKAKKIDKIYYVYCNKSEKYIICTCGVFFKIIYGHNSSNSPKNDPYRFSFGCIISLKFGVCLPELQLF